jgi:alpha-ketoglutarate-dependent taurine dioxygenase
VGVYGVTRVANELPFVIEADSETAVAAWAHSHRQIIDAQLSRSGAVLLRGFDVCTENDFKDLIDACCGQPLVYSYRSTPRTEVAPGIYTASEYPPGLSIPMHNENAYQRNWPLLLFFLCVYPAERGGQTPLADTLKVTDRIDSTIRQKFMEKRVMYIRNYGKDVDLPWQTVFQTESRTAVEEYCRLHDITYEWLPNGNLRTRQVCQSFAADPRTGKSVWFNQAHLFHPSSLDKRTRDVMSQTFKEENLPRNATYGDGSPIEALALDNIRRAFEQETVVFQWEAGDLLILNNMRVSHGRTPYEGKRRVLVAMAQPFSGVAA